MCIKIYISKNTVLLKVCIHQIMENEGKWEKVSQVIKNIKLPNCFHKNSFWRIMSHWRLE